MRSRNASGISLIEMVSVLFISSLVAGGVIASLSLVNATCFKTYNKLNSLTAAKRLEPVLKQELHTSKFFGDQFGTLATANSFPATENPDYFPPPGADEDGIFPPDTTAITYPTETGNSTWPARPYMLDEQTLVFQTPVFSKNYGFPEKYDKTNPNDSRWDVDTYVYKVLPDKSKPGLGQYVLQKTIFPGKHASDPSYTPSIASNSPQTVMTGIIGPIDPSGAVDPIANTPKPKVFNYLINDGTKIGNPSSAQTGQIRGVSVTVELFNNEASSRKDYASSTIAFSSEFFKRGNGAAQ